MPESRKRSTNKNRHSSKKNGQERPMRIDRRAPWKPSWWVLWGFITVVGEIMLISVTKAHVVGPSSVRIVVIAVCIPIVAHLLVSGIRTLLLVTSSR